MGLKRSESFQSFSAVYDLIAAFNALVDSRRTFAQLAQTYIVQQQVAAVRCSRPSHV
jgi:hypothetical protein